MHPLYAVGRKCREQERSAASLTHPAKLFMSGKDWLQSGIAQILNRRDSSGSEEKNLSDGIIKSMKKHIQWKAVFSKNNIMDYLMISLGSLIQAFGMVMFLIPAQLISGGISGLAQVLHHYTAWPIGTMTLLGNIPLFLIGWRYLGGFKFASRTIVSVILFSLATDLLFFLMPEPELTHDIFLNTIFGAVTLGLGFGLVYRGGGTSGGSDIIGRILNQRLGIPITQSYLFTDSASIILGAVAFGWELALYGMIAVYISGMAAEMVSEGNSIFRKAIIITSQPQKISRSIIDILGHTVTFLQGTGAYSGEPKTIVYCVINRSEVNQLKKLVVEADPAAFMVVGQANEVLGEGFQPYKYLN